MTPPTPSKPVAEDDTPMMQQYQRIKKQHADAILFFRMGDFYEMFNEDAKVASSLLEIALTSRNKNQSHPIPMCGVPHHSAHLYISKLIKAGKKVAICEQMEDPRQAKGLVKRDVVRVISPGTVLDDSLLDPKSPHYLVSVHFGRAGVGLAALDMSTGVFKVTEIQGEHAPTQLADELEKLSPKEILVPETAAGGNGRSHPLPDEHDWFVHPREDWTFSHAEAYRTLVEHFKTHSLEGFGCEDLRYAVSAGGALIRYLRDTQKSALKHINSIFTFHIHHSMLLDPTTVKSLELVQSSEGVRKNSLFHLLDLSQTPLGARRIRDWILNPLIDRDAIVERLDRVEAFKENLLLRNDLRKHLDRVYDLERLLGRIALAACSPRDLAALRASLETFPALLALLQQGPESVFSAYLQSWDPLEDVRARIDRTLVDDPPFHLKDGSLIKPGCHEELDRLQRLRRDSKTWIASLETQEKERTGIPVLKVGFNKIYGYYFEVTKKHLDRVPAEYLRKQSLVNAERFISPELKQYESEITSAEEKIQALELDLFQKLREAVAAEGSRIQHMARMIGEIDALAAFAEAAHRYTYRRPDIREDSRLRIRDGRHPLVERMDPSQLFVPNDALLDSRENQILILTGPNMAGKSTYLRQVALITLMAQMGCFVPAEEAEIGLVDRIFSRVGAQDHLLKGQSTFMVEMNEAANILNHATPRSLIILDEIGRGTSTFDGISIAWSIVEYLHRPEAGDGGPKTLFATHYHELTELALVLPGVKNYTIQVKEWNDEIIFLRKIAPGHADKSYGIQVARLAGLPERVIQRAHEVLFNLENSELDEVGRPKIFASDAPEKNSGPQQLALFSDPGNPIAEKLEQTDPDELTPRQALELMYELIGHWKRRKR